MRKNTTNYKKAKRESGHYYTAKTRFWLDVLFCEVFNVEFIKYMKFQIMFDWVQRYGQSTLEMPLK